MASDGKHSLNYKKDPLSDLRKTMGDLKGFKGAKVESNPWKDNEPRTSIDEFYAPHKGKVKK